jgi:hypothetical protein
VLVNRGPFRKRDSESFCAFIQDICDGYFPAEYKEIYPDGFLFELVDKHEANYIEEVSSSVAADSKVGYRIGGGANIANGNNNFTHNEAKAMSLDALCNRLPKTVINNGNIISIKDDIKSRLQGKAVTDTADAKESYNAHSRSASNGVSNSNSANVLKSNGIMRLESIINEGGDVSEDKSKQATIQVRFAIVEKPNSNATVDAKSNNSTDKKTITSNIVLQVQVHADEMMKDVAELLLQHYLQKYNNSSADISYESIELRNPYPSKVLRYDDTVSDAGYVPNGVMHARLTVG